MTIREVIRRLLYSCVDLDSELPCYVIQRDSHGTVTRKWVNPYNVIGCKLYVDMNGTEVEV